MNLELTRPLIFFDLETTGTDHQKDRIIEIYAKKYFPDGTTEEYYQLFNPLVPIEKEATDIHGFTKEALEKEPTFGKKATDVYNFFKDCDYAGYNCIKFDVPFLMEELTRHKQPFHPIKAKFVDPYKIISKKEGFKLEDVYERYFGEKFDNAHSAKADINATIRIFEEQINRYDLGTLDEISNLARSDSKGNEYIDFGGVFYKKDNEYYYGIGKYKGNPVGEHMSYLDWIVNKSDMQQNVKMVGTILVDYYKTKNKNRNKEVNS